MLTAAVVATQRSEYLPLLARDLPARQRAPLLTFVHRTAPPLSSRKLQTYETRHLICSGCNRQFAVEKLGLKRKRCSDSVSLLMPLCGKVSPPPRQWPVAATTLLAIGLEEDSLLTQHR